MHSVSTTILQKSSFAVFRRFCLAKIYFFKIIVLNLFLFDTGNNKNISLGRYPLLTIFRFKIMILWTFPKIFKSFSSCFGSGFRPERKPSFKRVILRLEIEIRNSQSYIVLGVGNEYKINIMIIFLNEWYNRHRGFFYHRQL